MRRTARTLLDPDAAPDVLPPGPAETAALTETLRHHLALLMPEVERLAQDADPASVTRYCALACLKETEGRLLAGPGAHGAVFHARRLARLLWLLCDHRDRLKEGSEWPEYVAYRRLMRHLGGCVRCGVEGRGVCGVREGLLAAYRRERGRI
ncbi:DUF6415 family natural product biosynthesis protein [Streptomyces sp. NPDC048290]|uniref:DUF6415 family natural product biosynthesis protein n=1 Tax=Streptomyces sp. NPDC048290 TaxID=3155811 RepID=UPI003435ECC0